MHAYYDSWPQCGEQEPVVEVAAVEEWDTADFLDSGATVGVSEDGDYVIVYGGIARRSVPSRRCGRSTPRRGA